MIDAFRESGSRVEAVYSRSESWGREFAARHGLARAFSDLRLLLADPTIQAVYVSSVNNLHEEQVVLAARAGKHILCDKPLATDLVAGRRMIDECRRAGVTLAVNHMMREQTAIKAMRDLIASGRCGTIQFARVLHAIELPEELRTWRLHDAEAGAGAALDLTVHDVDTLRFLLDDEVVDVAADCAAQGGAVAETALAAVLRMRRGCIAVIQDSLTVPNASTMLEVQGSRASLIGTGVLGQRPQGAVVIRTDQGSEDVRLPPLENPYVAVARAFAAAVSDPSCSPSATGGDGLASLEVALAVKESCRTRTHVTVTSPATRD